MANDNSSEYYLGMGMASGSGTLEIGRAKGQSYDSSSMPIKFGMMLDNDNRFEFSYEKEKHKLADVDNKVSGLNFDWNYTYPKYKIADAVTPYWTLGFGLYTYEDSANIGDNEDDLKGVAFNYGIGGLYDINKNIELETSYKFKGISWEDYNEKGSDIRMTAASVGSLFYLGLNYKL
jgi:opacity protein-like surface antigen